MVYTRNFIEIAGAFEEVCVHEYKMLRLYFTMQIILIRRQCWFNNIRYVKSGGKQLTNLLLFWLRSCFLYTSIINFKWIALTAHSKRSAPRLNLDPSILFYITTVLVQWTFFKFRYTKRNITFLFSGT